MSLTLLQGYSSAEEEEEEPLGFQNSSDDDTDSQNDDVSNNPLIPNKALFEPPQSSSSSSLPSASAVFSQVAGPPQFLNNCVEGPDLVAIENDGQPWQQGRRRNRREKNNLPAGAVVEAKAQLVGIRESVRSDGEGTLSNTLSTKTNGSSLSTTQGVKRVATATNPNAEDAADLLRMCLQCGVPKTFSNARGMICPICGDRPPAETDNEFRKKGSAIKDKEKSKRMKGQSSHATWKSETEMQLRQQFD